MSRNITQCYFLRSYCYLFKYQNNFTDEHLIIALNELKRVFHPVLMLLTFFFHSQGFEPTHSKQPEEITQYCEVYLFERGIDYDLALFVQLESARKFTREKTFALKGLIDFLNNEDYLD